MSAVFSPQERPVVDPLEGCDEAKSFYDKGDLSPPEEFLLLMHVSDSREHDPSCPAHDPNLASKLRSDLGLDQLPDE